MGVRGDWDVVVQLGEKIIITISSLVVSLEQLKKKKTFISLIIRLHFRLTDIHTKPMVLIIN